jgi:hypothetical protein
VRLLASAVPTGGLSRISFPGTTSSKCGGPLHKDGVNMSMAIIRAATVLCVLIGLDVAQGAVEQIVEHASGRGHRHLGPFTVDDQWELRWEVTEDHSLLQVVIHEVNDLASDEPIEIVTQRGPATGKKLFSKGGKYLLRIDGLGGGWTVMVVQNP